jgi:quinol monooxygenase YgiN
VIRSVLYLTPRGGDGRAIADFYRRHRVLERAAEQEGCLGADLELPADGSGDVLVTAVWRDADAYQGWLDNPLRSANAEELAELVDGFENEVRGSLYEIAIEAVPGR